MNERTRPSRRQILGAALLAAGRWPGTLRAADVPAESFHFICVNDVHCMDDESAGWLDLRALPAIRGATDKADFCLIVGDLAERGTAAELSLVRDVFSKLTMPVHVVPGNHDYAAGNSRTAYDDIFPKQLNYTFEHKGWQFVALDSTEGTKSKDVVIRPDTLQWWDPLESTCRHASLSIL